MKDKTKKQKKKKEKERRIVRFFSVSDFIVSSGDWFGI